MERIRLPFNFDVNFNFNNNGWNSWSPDNTAPIIPIPPTINFMITEGGDLMETEDGNLMILE